ncbi:MAG TPA: 4Fe-4S binding protein [Thermoleophilia bacterium]|nr:4Fe-4S binding protein [Thermoleophilia bacterium]HQG04108.1 4Fe-4S binding protein [Thermoleophilia bacterium]HQG55254.1 4Fe-4S binding protein [Thermoleophilia bacterium]HQJ98322.1 4Fe-4S binding protein [Thermoleophilia bacterium]
MPDEVKASSPGAARAGAGKKGPGRSARKAKKGPRPSARKAKADVLVDHDLCKACGICVALCPETVFDTDVDGCAVVARPAGCTACRLCEWHCPDFAIEVIVTRRVTAAPSATASTSTTASTSATTSTSTAASTSAAASETPSEGEDA